jgi:hypothetical protein
MPFQVFGFDPEKSIVAEIGSRFLILGAEAGRSSDDNQGSGFSTLPVLDDFPRTHLVLSAAS